MKLFPFKYYYLSITFHGEFFNEMITLSREITPTAIYNINVTLLSNTYPVIGDQLFVECPCISLYQFQKFLPNSYQVSISCSVGHNFNDIYNYMYPHMTLTILKT